MTQAPDRAPLLKAINDALNMIRKQPGAVPQCTTLPAPLGSLLAQCRELHQESARPEPLRTLHHLACTGGTLISKCLAVMPNTRLLSEIAPLTTIGVDPKKPRFVPSDLVLHLKTGLRPIDRDAIIAVFLAGMRELAAQSLRRGERLVVRDHAHSQFCVGPDVPDYPPLHHMLARLGPVLSVVTVRHPLDSYLSLLSNGWEHHKPGGFDEYCRRYRLFLAAHADLTLLRYEDFVDDPETSLRALCQGLEIPYNPAAAEIFTIAHISGDSGRAGSKIAPRSRRAVPDALAHSAKAGEAFGLLCAQLGYDGL
jgi:hypothetical protein